MCGTQSQEILRGNTHNEMYKQKTEAKNTQN